MGRVSVSERLLQTCYQFSLTARLAPKWNLLTYWLVQGKPLPLPCSNKLLTDITLQGWSSCQLEEPMLLVSQTQNTISSHLSYPVMPHVLLSHTQCWR